MHFFKELLLTESNKRAERERIYTISVVNKIYNEWKKTGRRKNAVDMVTTTVNKLSNIDPSLLNEVHEATKLKIATLLIRCMEIPVWKPIETKEKIYKKLFPLISALQSYNPQALTSGNIRDVIATRLSANLCFNKKDPFIFVAYEPIVPNSYLTYIFGSNELPEKIYKMQLLTLPEDFNSLIEQLSINLDKCKQKYNNDQTSTVKNGS